MQIAARAANAHTANASGISIRATVHSALTLMSLLLHLARANNMYYIWMYCAPQHTHWRTMRREFSPPFQMTIILPPYIVIGIDIRL